MLEVDDKAMAYYLIEALFAGGYINNPTYQNFLQMKHEQEEEEPPAKASQTAAKGSDGGFSIRAFLFA